MFWSRMAAAMLGCCAAVAQTSIPAPGLNGKLVGDFNGDGKQDLLLGQFAPQSGLTISVFLGNGDGTFSKPVVTSNKDATSVTAAADFNSDGKLDLVLTSGGLNLSFLLLGNGDGTFQSDPVAIDPQADLLVGAVADFNGDGKADLVVGPPGVTLPLGQIYFGNGDGTFTRGKTVPIEVSRVLGAPLAIGDVNLDGKADVIGSFSVYLSNGDGTFQTVPYTNSAEMLNAVTGAAIADLNGDGKPDLAYASSVGSGISAVVLFGNGDGTFSLGDFYALGPAVDQYNNVVIADFTQDGAPDIAVGSSPTSSSGSPTAGLTILANYGDGTFHNSASVPGLALGSKVLYGTMQVAGFENNGKPDLVIWDQPTAGYNSALSEVSVLMDNAPLVFPVLLGAVVNAASGSHGALSPGSLASAYTLPQPYPPAQAAALPLPSTLGNNVALWLNNARVPLLAISSTQVNFQVPWELASLWSIPIQFESGGEIYNFPPPAWEVNIAPFSPGIFTMSGKPNDQGVVTLANSSAIAAPAGTFPGSMPAARGDYVSIFCTGLGLVTNQPASGAPALSNPLSMTESIPKVTIGGVDAVVQFSGLAPGFVGVDQVNVQVPADAPVGGKIPLVIQTADGSTSSAVTIAVQ